MVDILALPKPKRLMTLVINDSWSPVQQKLILKLLQRRISNSVLNAEREKFKGKQLQQKNNNDKFKQNKDIIFNGKNEGWLKDNIYNSIAGVKRNAKRIEIKTT